MVLIYAAVGASRLGLTSASRLALRWAIPAGLAAGAVYATEIVLEYALRPSDNTAWGLIEFGCVFALFVVAGAGVSARQPRLWPAALAGVWTALIASLIWYAVALAVFYAFRGTVAQSAVLRAEGDFEDFRRSGMADFNVFAMQDFLGAGFYHLLLAPLFGLVLATLGAIPAMVWRLWQDKSAAKSAP